MAIKNIKQDFLKSVPLLQNKISKMYGESQKAYNPFLDKDGNVFNKHLNHQALLDNPGVSARVKQFISDATGLVPSTAASSAGSAIGGVTLKASGNGIADAAQSYLGTPYVWGGESMDEGGMDCSGFVYNALKDAGYKVDRTTAQGYRGYGNVVSKADMQPGDLIFYGEDNDASHIGIYLGNGQMIHSSGGSKNTKNNPGKGVTISNVDYRSDFIEARRY